MEFLTRLVAIMEDAAYQNCAICGDNLAISDYYNQSHHSSPREDQRSRLRDCPEGDPHLWLVEEGKRLVGCCYYCSKNRVCLVQGCRSHRCAVSGDFAFDSIAMPSNQLFPDRDWQARADWLIESGGEWRRIHGSNTSIAFNIEDRRPSIYCYNHVQQYPSNGILTTEYGDIDDYSVLLSYGTQLTRPDLFVNWRPWLPSQNQNGLLPFISESNRRQQFIIRHALRLKDQSSHVMRIRDRHSDVASRFESWPKELSSRWLWNGGLHVDRPPWWTHEQATDQTQRAIEQHHLFKACPILGVRATEDYHRRQLRIIEYWERRELRAHYLGLPPPARVKAY